MSDTTETVVINHSEFPLPPQVHEWPGIRVVECPREGEISPDIDGEVVLTRTDGGPNLADLLARSPRWVHTVGTGVDSFPFDALQGQTLTCSRGISGDLIGEWVFAQMLAAAKGLPDVFLDQPPADWSRPDFRVGTLRGATVVILGMGGIGSEVARLSLALDMNVIGVRRRGTDAPHPGMTVGSGAWWRARRPAQAWPWAQAHSGRPGAEALEDPATRGIGERLEHPGQRITGLLQFTQSLIRR